MLRPEINETRFPETYGDSIDGVIILGRLIADGGRRGKGGKPTAPGALQLPHDELARSARRGHVMNLHDPDTVVLPHLDSHDDFRASMACRTAAALAVELPLRSDDLDDPAIVERLVRASIRSQVGTTLPASPYFEFDAIDDPWLAANLTCVEVTRRVLPTRRLAIFVRATLAALAGGALAAAAARYARVTPAGTIAVLGVSGLHPEESTAEELAAYLEAVRIFDEAGFEVVGDRIDQLAPAAVASGAVGVAGGTRIYRVTPQGPFWSKEWSVKIRLKCAMPGRGDRMIPAEAIRRRDRGSVSPCPVEACKALEEEVPNDQIREHYAHLTQLELADARANGLEWVAERYEHSPIIYVRRLGEAVRIAMRRAQAA